MKIINSITLVAAMMLLSNKPVEALSLNSHGSLATLKLDDTTRRSVQRAAAAALNVAVAAKKAEAAESIKKDMAEVKKAESQETSDSI